MVNVAEPTKPPEAPLPPVSSWAPAVGLAWLIPGGGHFLMKRPGRGGLIAASVVAMFLLGLMMRGALFQPQSGDLLTTVIYYGGFIANVCSGMSRDTCMITELSSW
jgi:hypothetical protein